MELYWKNWDSTSIIINLCLIISSSIIIGRALYYFLRFIGVKRDLVIISILLPITAILFPYLFQTVVILLRLILFLIAIINTIFKT